MATEKNRIQVYLSDKIYQSVKDYCDQRKIKSQSKAVEMILADYFGEKKITNVEDDVITSILKRLANLESLFNSKGDSLADNPITSIAEGNNLISESLTESLADNLIAQEDNLISKLFGKSLTDNLTSEENNLLNDFNSPSLANNPIAEESNLNSKLLSDSLANNPIAEKNNLLSESKNELLAVEESSLNSNLLSDSENELLAVEESSLNSNLLSDLPSPKPMVEKSHSTNNLLSELTPQDPKSNLFNDLNSESLSPIDDLENQDRNESDNDGKSENLTTVDSVIDIEKVPLENLVTGADSSQEDEIVSKDPLSEFDSASQEVEGTSLAVTEDGDQGDDGHKKHEEPITPTPVDDRDQDGDEPEDKKGTPTPTPVNNHAIDLVGGSSGATQDSKSKTKICVELKDAFAKARKRLGAEKVTQKSNFSNWYRKPENKGKSYKDCKVFYDPEGDSKKPYYYYQD